MKIAVLGDTMQDIDVTCEIVKHYGDAPVLRELSRIERPGGASNVARMCEALGAEVLLLGPFGRTPTVKRRLLVDGVLIARHDTETAEPFVWTIQQQRAFAAFRPEAVIVCDHGKGFVTPELLSALPDLPTFIDPVATTPQIAGRHVVWIGSETEMPAHASGRKVIKRGADGLFVVDPDREAWAVESLCRDCVDDIGAGDQFLASLVVSCCAGMEWAAALHQANVDAGEQCRRVGIQPIQRPAVTPRSATKVS